MDKSIDSIGSCSLDADSTDFSDTSESLNFISPSSTREDFTAGITERCRKIQQPGPLTPKLILNQPNHNRNTTTAYFDISSGTYSTIVSRSGDTNGRFFNGITESFLTTKTIDLQSPTVVAHANKKPSYLNLACCVNGYSNYTNYDSVERKEINKSRDVSPIRPIITMSRQQRSTDNLLSVPGHTPVTFVKQSPLTSITKRFASLNINEKDTTDNAGVMNGNGSVTNRKSFIQQRVEKLYGTTKILTTVKSSDSIQLNGNGTITHLNGSSSSSNGTNGSITTVEKENDEDSLNSLPVMKHLRPEFAKQLQFMNSPKKSLTRTSTGNILLKSEQPKTDQPEMKMGNNITSLPPSKTNEISIVDLINSESVRKDCDSLMDRVVSKPEQIAVNEEKVVNNICEVSKVNKNGTMDLDSAKLQNNEIKDGNYFLGILNVEKERILKIAAETEKEFEQLQADPATAPSEEMIGVILAFIGKSRLLATKKFKQFEGLCEENLKPTSDGPATLCGDLQGFWDMMMLQVDNLNESHNEIKKCRANGWQKPEPPSPQAPKGSRMTKRPLTQSQTKAKFNVPLKKPSTVPTNTEAAQKREEQRKKLLEMKRKHKELMQNGGDENVAINGENEVNGKKENGNCEIIL